MRKNKEQAYKLRLSGNSYSEISKILNIPKSTLSGWFSQLVLSENTRKQINRKAKEKSLVGLLRHNKNQTKLAIARANRIKNESALEIENFSKKELILLGAALYWAEGYKRPIIRHGREVTYHKVSLTNSDPYLVKCFLRFLRELCCVPEGKIKASIRIFEHHNENELQRYWQKETGIKNENFGKVYNGISKSSMGKRPFNRLPYGVIQIVVADTNLFHKIMGYIEGIKRFM